MIAYIEGTVVPGKRWGRTIGFPTANVRPHEGAALPPDGVYVGAAALNGRWWPCVINQGRQPTRPSGRRAVEAHLLGYEGDLYGRKLTIAYLHYLRGERRFSSGEALSWQLKRDAASARAYFRGE